MLLCTNKFIDRLTTKAHPHHKKLKETPEERARAAAHKGFEVRRWSWWELLLLGCCLRDGMVGSRTFGVGGIDIVRGREPRRTDLAGRVHDLGR